ncbi:V(D)J recombination-activating protein 1-like [Hydractinia symbiolongicarpus]|uniref:V(D)J recombination-activating protein 1-like n=1 Tax=Hydractinia symbiolongicarpus TaxID=13093 RepID=UPI002550217A|nr:V(D)J recombination-activating protein 1-like [Hydractinia symbiolongicarpus]
MADPESQHNIYLTKLCRICQEHTGKVLRNALSVTKFSERIEKAFRIDLKGDHPTVHPRKICLKCYSLMKNVETKNTTPILNVKSWFPHNPSDCDTCKLGSIKSRGGKKTKSKSVGRPPKDGSMWTRHMTEVLYEKTPEDIIPRRYSREDFSCNKSLPEFICFLCKDILRRPVGIMPCEHNFCLECLVPNIEGRRETDWKCPQCKLLIKSNQINPSKKIQNLTKMLSTKCKRCGHLFNLDEEKEKKQHEASCISQSPTINDAKSDEAVLQIIRKKMAESKLPNKSIVFKTAGRVSTHFF